MTVCLRYRNVFGPLPTATTPDWNAGARSVASFESTCFFRFSVPSVTVGAIIGLNDRDDTGGFAELDHALKFVNGQVVVMESGVVVGPPSSVVASGSKYYIVRIGTKVLYCRRPGGIAPSTFYTDPEYPGWQFPGDVIYKSTKPSSGTVFLDCSLYSMGDRITNELAGIVWFPGLEGDPAPLPGTEAGAVGYGHLTLVGGAAGGAGEGMTSFAIAQGEMPLSGSGSMTAAAGAHGELRFDGFASGEPLAAFARGELVIEGSATGGWADDLYPTLSGANGILLIEGSGSSALMTGTGAGELNIVGFGSSFATPPAGGIVGAYGELTIEGYALGAAVDLSARITAYLRFATNLDPSVGPDPDPDPDYTVTTIDSLTISSQAQIILVVKPVERLRLLDQYQRFSQTSAQLADAVRINDEIALLLAVTLVDALEATSPLVVVQVAQMLDRVGLGTTTQLALQAFAAITEATRVGDNIYDAVTRSVLDGVSAADTMLELARYLTLLLDEVETDDELELRRLVLVEVLDETAVATSAPITAQYFAELLSQVRLYALVTSSADVAQGWVMNTEGERPVSEYDNFEFTSLAWYQGQLWGTLDDGLYLLEGDDDAGTAIQAEITSLLLDFATSRQKHVRTVYLGYTSTGKLVLKVRSVDEGKMTEKWYSATPRVADAPREKVMQPGRGLRSRYWQFELANVDGADFAIDHLELYPVILGRRV